jgi:hypothetical protein
VARCLRIGAKGVEGGATAALKATRGGLGVRVHGQGHEMLLGQRGCVVLGVRPEVGDDQRTPLGNG